MELEDKIGYHFKNKELLTVALTHSSYANERKTQHIQYNERLEFLGDAVLSIVVSDYIFKHCPELPEGELTKLRATLVCEKMLFEFAKQIDLGSYLLLSKGERNNGGANRPSIVSDAFEALIAAIYIDGGMAPASKHILNFVIPAIKNAIPVGDYDTIFLGYPMWWYTFPMIIYTLFDQYDFSGKTIIPFNTHMGSKDGGTYKTVKRLAPNATVLDGLPVEMTQAERGDAEHIAKWLKSIKQI